MHRTEIARKELKIHFKDKGANVTLNSHSPVDSADLMPVVRLLSIVDREYQQSR